MISDASASSIPNQLNAYQLLQNPLQCKKNSFIYEAIDTSNQRKCAIKVYFADNQNPEQQSQIRLQDKISQLADQHSHLIKIHEILDVQDAGMHFYALVMPMARCDLFQYCSDNQLHNNISGNLDVIKRIMKQCLLSVAFLHSKQIGHFDIKPNNFLIMNESVNFPILKLADFDLSQVCGDNQYIGGVRGTLPYQSPEMLNYHSYNLSTDIWSLGILFYFLITGKTPYKPKNPDSQDTIDFDQPLFPESKCKEIEDIKEIIEGMLCLDPNQRPSASELLEWEFFAKIEDVFEQDKPLFEDEIFIEIEGLDSSPFETQNDHLYNDF